MGNKDEKDRAEQDTAEQHTAEQDKTSQGLGADSGAARLLRQAPNCTTRVQAILTDLAELNGESLSGGLASGASLADSVIALARARNMLDAQIARRLARAMAADCLRGTPRATLIADGGWAGSSAAAMIAAAEFADHHDEVAGLWRSGVVSLEAVAALARGLAPLPVDEQEQVVRHPSPSAPTAGAGSPTLRGPCRGHPETAGRRPPGAAAS